MGWGATFNIPDHSGGVGRDLKHNAWDCHPRLLAISSSTASSKSSSPNTATTCIHTSQVSHSTSFCFIRFCFSKLASHKSLKNLKYYSMLFYWKTGTYAARIIPDVLLSTTMVIEKWCMCSIAYTWAFHHVMHKVWRACRVRLRTVVYGSALYNTFLSLVTFVPHPAMCAVPEIVRALRRVCMSAGDSTQHRWTIK